MNCATIGECLTDQDIRRFLGFIEGMSCEACMSTPVPNWIKKEIDLFIREMPEPSIDEFRERISDIFEHSELTTSKEDLKTLFLVTMSTYYHSLFRARLKEKCPDTYDLRLAMRIRFQPIVRP